MIRAEAELCIEPTYIGLNQTFLYIRKGLSVKANSVFSIV